MASKKKKKNSNSYWMKFGGSLHQMDTGGNPQDKKKTNISKQEELHKKIRLLNLEMEGIDELKLDSMEAVRYIQEIVPKLKKHNYGPDDFIRYIKQNRPDLIEYRNPKDEHIIKNIRGWEGLPKMNLGGDWTGGRSPQFTMGSGNPMLHELTGIPISPWNPQYKPGHQKRKK